MGVISCKPWFIIDYLTTSRMGVISCNPWFIIDSLTTSRMGVISCNPWFIIDWLPLHQWLACSPRMRQIVGSNTDWIKPKNYKIGTFICCFYAKHAALRRKNKDWFDRNRDNVPECGDNFYPRIAVSVNQHYTNPTSRVGLEQSGPHHHLIEN